MGGRFTQTASADPLAEELGLDAVDPGYRRWLDPNASDPAPPLTAYPDGEVEANSVSPLVDTPANDVPECNAPEQPKGTLPLSPDW